MRMNPGEKKRSILVLMPSTPRMSVRVILVVPGSVRNSLSPLITRVSTSMAARMT